MSYRTWHDPPRKGDEEPFPGSPDDMMNTVAALRAQNAELVAENEGLKERVAELQAEVGYGDAILAVQNTKLVAALKLARIPFAASLSRRSDRDEAEQELAQIDAALAAAGQSQGSGK